MRVVGSKTVVLICPGCKIAAEPTLVSEDECPTISSSFAAPASITSRTSTSTIPRDKLVVITGVSGSGKSSLAFDTIYAEGQRRYVESLSAYARQFLGQMEKPDVDYIEGLSPAISIDQKGASPQPALDRRARVTEIYDYLRLLYARAGRPHCPQCGQPIQRQTVQQIVDSILDLPPGRRLMVLAPIIRDRKGEHHKVFEDARKPASCASASTAQVRDLDEQITLDRYKMHTIEVVVDRAGHRSRRSREDDSARVPARRTRSRRRCKLGGGIVDRAAAGGRGEGARRRKSALYSEHFACVDCGLSFGELEPRNFSFNSPHGACPRLHRPRREDGDRPGAGHPEQEPLAGRGRRSSRGRAPAPSSTWYMRMLEALARKHHFSVQDAGEGPDAGAVELVLYGDKGEITISYTGSGGHANSWDTTFEGVITNLSRRYKETDSDYIRTEIEKYMAANPCPACGGARLKPESLRRDRRTSATSSASRSCRIVEALEWVERLQAPGHAAERARADDRLPDPEGDPRPARRSSVDVGLDYLTLDRAHRLRSPAARRSASAWRRRSAPALMGVLYVCDEPSIGLHPADDDAPDRARSSGCATSATRSWSSSTTRR